MNDKELMQMALDALENHRMSGLRLQAIPALRAALAQPEQEHSASWWKHEVSNAFANGYEKGRASTKQPEQAPTNNGRYLTGYKAQPEPEPVAWKDAPSKIYLQVCEESNCDQPFDSHIEISWCQDKINDSDIPYVRADIALSQPPEQEPAVWIKKDRTSVEFSIMSADYMMKEGFDPLYTAPPQREWQGLTDDEIQQTLWKELGIGQDDDEISEFARAIEAKLKEKNNG